jgi:hypothetical protein
MFSPIKIGEQMAVLLKILQVSAKMNIFSRKTQVFCRSDWGENGRSRLCFFVSFFGAWRPKCGLEI